MNRVSEEMSKIAGELTLASVRDLNVLYDRAKKWGGESQKYDRLIKIDLRLRNAASAKKNLDQFVLMLDKWYSDLSDFRKFAGEMYRLSSITTDDQNNYRKLNIDRQILKIAREFGEIKRSMINFEETKDEGYLFQLYTKLSLVSGAVKALRNLVDNFRKSLD